MTNDISLNTQNGAFAMVMPPQTRPGDVYNGIKALRFDHIDSHGNYHWLFRCRCGTQWVCCATSVRRGHTKSCGKCKCASGYRRGESKGRKKEYQALHDAISQCENPNHPWYPEVGAKGIKVCARWKSSFENFLADVGRCPVGKRYFQRIDREKDFERGNVRWAIAECHELYMALLKERCEKDGLGCSTQVLRKQFQLHLHRGIGYLATPNKIRSIGDLIGLVPATE